ncbi:MAG: hypothetical protein NVS9B15_02710 [Acidobacteriaceae bacterium]
MDFVPISWLELQNGNDQAAVSLGIPPLGGYQDVEAIAVLDRGPYLRRTPAVKVTQLAPFGIRDSDRLQIRQCWS